MNEEKKNDVNSDESKKISLEELEKMSGGGGMEKGYTHTTGDMPKGATK